MRIMNIAMIRNSSMLEFLLFAFCWEFMSEFDLVGGCLSLMSMLIFLLCFLVILNSVGMGRLNGISNVPEYTKYL